MMKKTFYLSLVLLGLVALISPISTYAQQCDQSFGVRTIRQGESQTVSDSMTNPSSNPFVVEQFAIEYQGGASNYVQGSPFVSQPYSSIASDIVAGSSTVSLGGVNGFVVTNAATRDFVIRFKVQGYHIESNDACIANPALPCTALSYLTHYECQPLTVTKCGDGIVDAGYEQCDGSAGVGANQSCSNTCQIVNNPVNCQVSDWSEWGSCNAGTQTRTRTITVQPANGGQACPALSESQSCDYCGDGVQNNGEQCDGTAGVGANQSCTNQCTLVNNPVNCSYTWGNWSACNGSTQTRNPIISVYPVNGGQACPQPETQSCTNPPVCGDGIKNGSEQCDYTDGSHNGWGRDGCNNSCQPINNPRYKCSNYACIQDDGNGTYTTNNCNNSCGTAPYCGDGIKNNNEQCDGTTGVGANQSCTNQCTLVNNPYCGDGIKNGSEQCDYTDGSHNGWGNSGCSNSCQPINNPVCQDANAENNGQVGACVYKYACNNSYQCVQQKGGAYGSNNCDNACKPPVLCNDPNAENNGSTTQACIYKYACNNNNQCVQQKGGAYGSNNCDNACTPPPTVDVQIVKIVDRPVFPNNTGELITWTLNYKNNGPAVASGVVVVDVIPKELAYLVGPVDGSKYTFTAVAKADGTTQVTWIFKDLLPVGATGSFTVRTEYRGGYPDNNNIINAVAIRANNDSNPNNNSDTEITKPYSPTIPQADVQITKTVDRATFPNTTGEIVTWTLNYKNNGPSTAESVVVTDTLPIYLELVSSIPTAAKTSPIVCVTAPCITPITWNLGSLAVGQTGSIQIVTKYLGGATNNQQLINNTRISTTTTGDNPNNNTGSAVTTPYGSGTASLGNYVWIDADKDGVQDANEVSLSGVKVDLYKINSCTAELTTPIATTTTNGSGLYLFTGLAAGNYKVKFTLPNGYEFTMPNQGSDDAVDSDAGLNGVTNCITLAEGENNMTVDAGVILNQPISCEGLTLNTTTITVGGSVGYACTHKNATSAVVTVTLSGSTTGVVSMTGFTGQFTINAAGTYNVQCTLDNGITYKVVSYAATGTAINCAYLSQANNVNMCAKKVSLDPYLTSGVNLSGLIYMPTPYPYCTDAQMADTTYACVAAPAGAQILTRVDNMCRAQLTVSNGGGGGGCTSNCGGGHYNFCGDGAVNNGEECDGNNKAGYICTNQCKYAPTGTPTPSPHNPTKPKLNLPSCESIDPPSVNKGEYLPFWWELESDSDVNFVSNCSNAVAGKTNVIRGGSDRSDDPLCHFRMYVDDTAKTPAAEFSKYCYQDSDLKSYTLFQDFFSTRSESGKGYMRSKTDGGSAFFGPSSWADVPNKYGEYKLSLDGSTFYVCEETPVSGGTSTWRQSAQRYEAKNAGGYTTECSFNFTVTTPYFVQQGKSLGTVQISQGVLNNFFSFDTRGSIIDNILQISQYQRTNNLAYLGQQFADKYTRFAKPITNNVNFNKVPGKEIYVKVGNGDLTIAGGDLPRGTIISNGGDITIQGNLRGKVMMIANGGTIYFEGMSKDEVQQIEGIYIADHVQSLNQVFNKDLSKGWASKGGIRVKGIIISKDANDIEQIYGSRRSYLENWFKTDAGGSNHKREAILNGAALTIETDPSFWTSLPPGANELISALETYK